MSLFKVNVTARNPKDESLITPPTEVLVDTGSELTWLPADLLSGIKVTRICKRSVTTATKQIVTRETGYAILNAEGFETVRGDEHYRGLTASSRTTCPPFITNFTRSISVTSASGLPLTAMTSANLPFSRLPTRSDQP